MPIIKVGLVLLLIIGLVFFFWPGYPPYNFITSLISQKSPQIGQTNQATKKGLGSHQMPKLLNIDIKSDVNKEDGEKMSQGFKVMDFYLNEWFGKSITKKSAIRVEATSGDSKFKDENGTIVFLYLTQSRDWQLPKQIGAQFNMDMRSRAAAHEYVHLYQINNGCANTGRAGEKVKWFLEGEAEWLSYKASDESGNLPFFFSNGQWSSFLTKQIGADMKPLQTYEKGENLDNAYPYFTLAIEFLMKNRQIKTLDDFCVNLGKGEDLSAAFENTFGIPLAKFYSDFANYRQNLAK